MRIPKRIKKVRSIGENDCCLACISMITEIDLAEIKSFVIDNSMLELYPKEQFATFGIEVIQILKKLGIWAKPVKYYGVDKLKHHAILFVSPINDDKEDSHAIVWDNYRKCIVDPSGRINKRLLLYNVYMCIEIIHGLMPVLKESKTL